MKLDMEKLLQHSDELSKFFQPLCVTPLEARIIFDIAILKLGHNEGHVCQLESMIKQGIIEIEADIQPVDHEHAKKPN
jgi:hypothetical protein